MQFVPLWDSILDSLKMHRLPLETIGKWTWILACAQRHDRDNGTLPDLETLSFWLRHPEEEVKEWLDELVAAKLVDRQGKTCTIHDWNHWRASKDPKARERMKNWRERQKNGGENGEADRNVTRNVTPHVTEPVTEPVTEHVTPVTPPRKEKKQRSIEKHTHPAPADAGACACVCEVEPFEPEENPEIPPSIVIAWTPEEKRIIDRATERWGASCGDSCVGDLLKRYPAAFVGEMCDKHYATVQKAFDFRRLDGLCRALWDGGNWKPQTSSRGSPAASQPIGGQNGSGNTVTPTQRLKTEEADPPLTVEQLLETIAGLEAVRRRSKFQEMLLQQTREELAQR